MANSMTGFGRGEAKGCGYQISVEIKTVNNRFLEVVVKLPRNLNSIEERFRKAVQEKVQRGRADIYINIKETEEKKRLVKVDKDLVLSYDNSLKELANLLNTEYKCDLFSLVTLPEVLNVENEETSADDLWPFLESALKEAIDRLVCMRRDEGNRLTSDLLKRIDDLAGLVDQITLRAPKVVVEYQEKLRDRLSTLLADTAIEETRFITEVAIFADRASIEEELVRLRSHFVQFRDAFAASEPIGRKLDFLVQEMNREINTIGSKANDMEISRIVVQGKSDLEKIREQVQNIE
ncbi:YicC family protein [Dehalobacter sp. DCM]|uniref:YicC/YloC family endoribonuclease n=1 Tax=Dehalobacter sp. DCM TaxID=2907827 RepID=UPI0030821CD7|nr:YicC family protein [Dehalobacter sp. DCM]